MTNPYLSDFSSVDPPFTLTQEAAYDWLAEAYAKTQARTVAESERWIRKFSAKPDQVATRGHFSPDFTHRRWDEMTVFEGGDKPRAGSLASRMDFFRATVESAFDDLYGPGAAAPEELIHVTCTGYVSPSAPLVVASKRGWFDLRVTQLYHSGCFAAVPAVRLASSSRSGVVDVVHTELCSLHFDVDLFTPEQIVVQSLFADGVIRYRCSERARGAAFKVESVSERIIPESLDDMTWIVRDRNFRMTLARSVPAKIRDALPAFVQSLRGRCDRAIYAIHPGGPLVIQSVAEALGLSPDQYHHSLEVLKRRGNMSSATLPSVWRSILEDTQVPAETPVLSLAFGPGLTLCGTLMKKVDG